MTSTWSAPSSGATSYLRETAAAEDVVNATRQAAGGTATLSPDLLTRFTRALRLAGNGPGRTGFPPPTAVTADSGCEMPGWTSRCRRARRAGWQQGRPVRPPVSGWSRSAPLRWLQGVFGCSSRPLGDGAFVQVGVDPVPQVVGLGGGECAGGVAEYQAQHQVPVLWLHPDPGPGRLRQVEV
jgi:hypothetical protein